MCHHGDPVKPLIVSLLRVSSSLVLRNEYFCPSEAAFSFDIHPKVLFLAVTNENSVKLLKRT